MSSSTVAGSLTDRFPKVAAQWHPSRNGQLTAEDVAGQASHKAWWLCSAGHEWQEPVSQRTSIVPKWKHGDPAACRRCVPVDRLSERAQIEFRFECGHTTRTTVGTSRHRPEKCQGCYWRDREASLPERRRKRRQELTQEARALGQRPTATPAQRHAQRVLVATTQRRSGRMHLDVESRELRFVECRNDSGPLLDEIREYLTVLEVPYEERRAGGRLLFGAKAVMLVEQVELVVLVAGREQLFRWIPSLAAKVARTEGFIV